MVIALILLSIALMLLTVYILYYKKQIKDIGNQLSFISKHHSFKFIQTQIKPREISQLIYLCNTMLSDQRELHQEFTQKSEEINATIINLSHDIRTPITSLDGYLQLAKRSNDFNKQKKYIAMAETRMKQIITLVDELFLYTKLQNPAYHLELEKIDMVNVLEKGLFSFYEEFSQRGVEPNVTLPDLPIHIVGNKGALERVCENVIKNYVLHGEGDLTIRYEEHENEELFYFSNLLRENQQINMDKIFTRFYKEDTSRTNHSSGLGLSIIHSLVKKMNGSVHADLNGNQFCIRLAFPKLKKENENVR